MSDLPLGPPKTVPVVDDSPSIRTLFRIDLRRLSVEVLFAQDGVLVKPVSIDRCCR